MAEKRSPLVCERSYLNFPIGETWMSGWVYICDFNCPREAIVRSAYARSVYCSSMEEFYKTVGLVLQRGGPVGFGRDYFIVRLPQSRPGFVERCLTEGIGCMVGEWFMSAHITPSAAVLFTTDKGPLEELFRITTRRPFMGVSGVDIMTHAISEAVKDMETATAEMMSILALGKYKGMTPGKALGNYAAVSEALAQIVSGCFAFGSDFIRRNMRFMTCGNFAPIPYLIGILRNMKNCEKARDWDCMYTWIVELDDLISAYRRPGPPYVPPDIRRDIFRFRRSGA